jgi:hypothetical protein
MLINNRKAVFIFLLWLSAIVCSQNAISIGDRRELFVDRYLIDRLDNVQMVLHEPHDEGMVLHFDKPWEGPFCGYTTVIKDNDLYRMYYRGLPSSKGDGSDLEVTCVAESHDGKQWTKPNLGLYKINNTKKNNVILAHVVPANHNFSPFLDSRKNIPANERYKALGGTEKSGLLAFYSADGIHWRQAQKDPVLTNGMFDSQNVAFWSETEGCYICYFRTWTGKGYAGFRTVSRTTSTDFLHWTPAHAMSYGNTPMEHIYINQTHPYFNAPHIYIAVAARFMPNRQVLTDDQAQRIQVNPKYFQDCSDAVLMTSRGDTVYDRTFMEAFIAPGLGRENWVSRSNYPALNIVQTGTNEMSVYVNRNYAQPTSGVHRYSMRLDGLASLYAPYAGGEMISKPIRFIGEHLEINYRTSAAGEIYVEIQDENGNVLPGFSLQDCQPIIGNELARIVSWKNNPSLAALQDRPIRLRFRLKDAHLYAIKFGR